MARIAAVLVVLCAFVPLPMAAAQNPPQVELRLDGLSPWVGPDDTLQIGLTIRNRSEQDLKDLRVQLSVHEAVRSRSELDDSFRGRLRAPPAYTDLLPIAETVEAGGERSVSASKKLSEISFLQRDQDGVHPISITLFRPAGRGGRVVAAPPINTQLIFFTGPVAQRLRLVMVIPFHTAPAAHPSGTLFTDDFLDAIDRGRIWQILNALDAYPQVPITLAPSGIFLDTLADLEDGFELRAGSARREVHRGDREAQAAADVLTRLRLLAGRPAARMLPLPYSAAYLPGLSRFGMADRISAQVEAGANALRVGIGYEPLSGWLYPTRGALDEEAFDPVLDAGSSHLILSPAAVRRSQTPLTLAAPVEVRTKAGTASALVEDRGLDDALDPDSDVRPLEARQRFLAQTAAILLERPAQLRAVAVSAPPDWDPHPSMFLGILQALTVAPWLVGTTPDAAEAEIPPGPRVELASNDAMTRSGPEAPSREYFDSMRAARRAIDELADLRPGGSEGPALLRRLERRLLVAESADWWSSPAGVERGRSFSRSIISTVADQFKKVSPPEVQTVTFTSRSGTIPLVLNSRVDYPVTVKIRLESEKLRFGTARCGARASEGRCEITTNLLPRAQTLDIPATASVTGSIPLRVTLLTAGRHVPVGTSRLVVRSTEYNQTALAITGAAASFLVLWWLAGLIRRRPPREEAARRQRRAGPPPVPAAEGAGGAGKATGNPQRTSPRPSQPGRADSPNAR